jgi:hypothetical protein
MKTIATLFMGITAFFSSLFGSTQQHVITTQSAPILGQASTTQKTIQENLTEATDKPQIQAQTKNTSDKLITYQSDLGYEIQYPEKWTINSEILSDVTIFKNSGTVQIPSIVISKEDASSLEEWYTKKLIPEYKQIGETPVVKNITINNIKALDIRPKNEIEPCIRDVVLYHDGKIFRQNILQPCTYNDNDLDSIIFSFKFIQPKTTESEAVEYVKNDAKAVIVRKDVDLVNNEASSTLLRDFGWDNIEVIYTTEDKNKTYFFFYTNGEEWSPSCVPIEYLDIKEKVYVSSQLQYCIGMRYTSDLKKYMPFIIQEGKFDFKTLYLVNLEKETETIMYKKKNDSESLVAKCSEFGNYEAYRFFPDIEYLPKNRIRIGVYKNTGQDKIKCTKETQAHYEKIRDDIVDLTKFQ